MNPPDAPDPLEALLRRNTPTLRDDAFTERVLLALPPPRRSRRPAAIAIGTVAGLVCLLASGIRWSDTAVFLPSLETAAEDVSRALLSIEMLTAGLTTAVSLWLARLAARRG